MTEARVVPETASTIRLVRPVGDDLREYEAMETAGGARAIRAIFRVLMIRPAHSDSYGLADLLDSGGDIVGEIELDRRDFQRLRKRLRCRVVREDATHLTRKDTTP